MVLAHNLTAMNAQRQFNIVGTAKRKSTEKLSSGYKINRAADDAAGLSISEKMRKQIRGLDRASDNCQDGVSLCQVADGALAETHEILQRINELSIQSANGTNSSSDRAAIQAEVKQLTDEIDRIATTTSFNERIFPLSAISNESENIKNKVWRIYANDVPKECKLRGDERIFDSKEIKNKTYAYNSIMPGWDLVFAQETSENFNTNGDDPFVIISRNSLVNNDDKQWYYIMEDNNNIMPKGTYHSEFPYGDHNGLYGTFEGKGDLVMGYELDISIEVMTDVSDTDFEEFLQSLSISINNNGKVTFVSKYLVEDEKKRKDFINEVPTHAGSESDMTLKIPVNIVNATKKGLGLTDPEIDLSTEDGATAAIDRVKNAIEIVSGYRSYFGATQNRLEHTIANLDNVVENTQAAESRIRDTDMAKEMVNNTKHNILEQAVTSMMTQANQSTQGVLSLLQ